MQHSALALLLAVGLWGAGGAALAQGVPAVRVNGTVITMERVDQQFEDLLRERNLNIARMRDPNKARDIKREALDILIQNELLWQEARKNGLMASDAEVNQTIAEARKRFRSAAAFDQKIELAGYTAASWRDNIRKLLSGDRMAQLIVDRDVKISEADIDGFYEINPQLFKRAEQAKLRQILVAVPEGASAEKKAQARAQAEALLQRARGGESFDALARQNSDDATRQWGGELDPISRSEQPSRFEEVAFALQPDALSEVFETPAGWHIIKLEKRLPAMNVPLADVRARIRDYLTKTRGKEAVDKAVAQLRESGKLDRLIDF